jgi:hypothetical protein|uniref:Uncharacterized protein n=1 Tax=viral metagenome TaxID=1070528 RepID=A0A6C0C0R1_9ZZZZ
MSNFVSQINEIQNYSLNINNIERISKYFENKNVKDKKKDIYKDKEVVLDSSYFIPNEKDRLFWIFYILKYGMYEYDFIDKRHFFIEQKEKIKLVELVREKKDILKKNKWKRNKIESMLVGEKKIDLNTFFCICYLNNINLCIINKKCLYDCISESFNTEISIMKKVMDEYSINLDTIDLESYNKMKDKYWIIENISKPIKAISSYKVTDLISICKKLGIEITKTVNDKKKNLTKKELYSSILEYI